MKILKFMKSISHIKNGGSFVYEDCYFCGKVINNYREIYLVINLDQYICEDCRRESDILCIKIFDEEGVN